MWQLRTVYLGCNLALGYAIRTRFPPDKGFFIIAVQRSRMLHGLVWAKFRVFSLAVRKI